MSQGKYLHVENTRRGAIQHTFPSSERIAKVGMDLKGVL